MIRPGLFLASLAVCLAAWLPAHAERIMDSVDALTLAVGGTEVQLQRGDYKDLLTTAKKAAQLAQDRFGPLHPSVAPYFDNLGVVEETMALYPQAEADFEWALALRERAWGPDDPDLAPALDSMASLDDQRGLFPQALVEIQRALRLEKNSKDGETPGSLALQGDIESHAGQAGPAQADWERALKAGPTPEQKIDLLKRLGWAEAAQGHAGQAIEDLQEALAEAQKDYKRGDVRIADSRKELGDLYLAQGRAQKGKPLLEQALAAYLHFIGPEDTYANIPYHQRGADAYFSLGQWAQAAALYRRILAIKTGVYGPQHPEVALTLADLAKTAEKQGDRAEAEKDLSEALRILSHYFPDGHPLVAELSRRRAALR